MSQPAYSKARNKFDHTPFVTMFRELVKDEYSGDYKHKKYIGYYVFATDGSYNNLPKTAEMIENFNTFGDSSNPMGGASIVFDVLNERIIDANLVPCAMNERLECENHVNFMLDELNHLIDKLILLLDRGYPSLEMFLKLQNSGVKFIIRCTSCPAKEIADAPMGLSEVTLTNGVRLVVAKFLLADGTEQTLVSNLFDFTLNDFQKLYKKRWEIEGMYNKLKNIYCIENFSGKSVNSIYQDFWATLVMFNLTADLFDEANKQIKQEQEDKSLKHEYKARYSNLVLTLRERFIKAFYADDPDLLEEELMYMLETVMTEIKRTKSPIRQDRSFPRNPKIK